jgi:carbonic anhydrase
MNDRAAISADEALQQLIEGNSRFARGEPRMEAPTRERLAQLALGQRPFATILGCSDSRVAPEWLFDAGLGELFVIRVAGNVFSPEVAGSLQYAGAHLRTPLFMVLGHEGCGAVQAALATKVHGTRDRSRIQLLVDGILPALADIDPGLAPNEQLARAIESNVRWTMRTIRETPEGRARLAEGQFKLVGAIYEIETGRIRLLDGADEGLNGKTKVQ